MRRVVAANIRRLAKKRRLSLNICADLAGIDRSGLYRVLSLRATITVDRLVKIARALEVEPHELLKVFKYRRPSHAARAADRRR